MDSLEMAMSGMTFDVEGRLRNLTECGKYDVILLQSGYNPTIKLQNAATVQVALKTRLEGKRRPGALLVIEPTSHAAKAAWETSLQIEPYKKLTARAKQERKGPDYMIDTHWKGRAKQLSPSIMFTTAAWVKEHMLEPRSNLFLAYDGIFVEDTHLRTLDMEVVFVLLNSVLKERKEMKMPFQLVFSSECLGRLTQLHGTFVGYPVALTTGTSTSDDHVMDQRNLVYYEEDEDCDEEADMPNPRVWEVLEKILKSEKDLTKTSVMVFVTGKFEIEFLVRYFEKYSEAQGVRFLALHTELLDDQKWDIWRAPLPRVMFTTKDTILGPGLEVTPETYIVDSCQHRPLVFSPDHHLAIRETVYHAKCFTERLRILSEDTIWTSRPYQLLVTEEEWNALPNYPTAEIQLNDPIQYFWDMYRIKMITGKQKIEIPKNVFMSTPVAARLSAVRQLTNMEVITKGDTPGSTENVLTYTGGTTARIPWLGVRAAQFLAMASYRDSKLLAAAMLVTAAIINEDPKVLSLITPVLDHEKNVLPPGVVKTAEWANDDRNSYSEPVEKRGDLWGEVLQFLHWATFGNSASLFKYEWGLSKGADSDMDWRMHRSRLEKVDELVERLQEHLHTHLLRPQVPRDNEYPKNSGKMLLLKDGGFGQPNTKDTGFDHRATKLMPVEDVDYREIFAKDYYTPANERESDIGLKISQRLTLSHLPSLIQLTKASAPTRSQGKKAGPKLQYVFEGTQVISGETILLDPDSLVEVEKFAKEQRGRIVGRKPWFVLAFSFRKNEDGDVVASRFWRINQSVVRELEVDYGVPLSSLGKNTAAPVVVKKRETGLTVVTGRASDSTPEVNSVGGRHFPVYRW